MTRPTVLVLVGLPGAGKSTVGPMVAQRLAWRFVDLDVEIEHGAGMPVREIFETGGESEFRRLEHEATRRLASTERLVLAPGGGWITDPRNLALFGDRSLTVYLRVSPAVAVARMGAGMESRPLLAVADPVSAVTSLLEARDASYLQANHTLAVDRMAPAEVADTIVALATDQIAD